MSNPRTLVGGLAARLLGAVLLLAAYAKAIDPHGFARGLRETLPVPSGLAFAAALALVAFEAGLGAALLAGRRDRGVLLLTTATFVAFLGVVAWQLVRPSEAAASCGCFGQLLERTPWQAFWEDVGFVGLTGLAWLGRPAPATASWRIPALVAGVAAAFAAAAPRLPLDDHATALAPGVTVTDTRLDEAVPELRTGRHLVLLLDRADPATQQRVPELNARLGAPGGKTPVWGVADDDRALATAFLFAAGPAFEVRGASPAMLRRLYRMLPRSALIEDGRVIETWTGFPPDPVLEALARGERP